MVAAGIKYRGLLGLNIKGAPPVGQSHLRPRPLDTPESTTMTIDPFDRVLDAAVTLPTEVVAHTRPALKRGFDIGVAACALFVLAPALALIALAIKLDSRGPVFFRVRRVGFRGTTLHMLKFRKMHDDATGGPLTAGADPRFTRVGVVLTRCRLDELPQLWDVLRGRMSLVGPRPEDPAFVDLHDEAYRRILTVRPGIAGLSQLAFAEEAKILKSGDMVSDYIDRILPQKVALDTMYASSTGIRRDISVLFWTAATVVLRRPVAVHRGTGALTLRRRPAQAAAPAVVRELVRVERARPERVRAERSLAEPCLTSVDAAA